jgi:hypothetical protein
MFEVQDELLKVVGVAGKTMQRHRGRTSAQDLLKNLGGKIFDVLRFIEVCASHVATLRERGAACQQQDSRH